MIESSNIVPSPEKGGYESYRKKVLLWDAITAVPKSKRVGNLVIRLQGQYLQYIEPHLAGLLKIDNGDENALGLTKSIKTFLELMDKEFLGDKNDEEFREISTFLRIKRTESSLADFVTRFNIAKERCFVHLPYGEDGSEPLTPKFVSTLLIESSALRRVKENW